MRGALTFGAMRRFGNAIARPASRPGGAIERSSPAQSAPDAPTLGNAMRAEARRRQPLIVGPGGVTGPEPSPFPVGPGGVVGRFGMSPERAAALDTYAETAGRWGREAGALAAEGRYRPQYSQPDPEVAEMRERFGGQAPAFGPGGALSSSAASRASSETGVSETYLDALTAHESGGDRYAKASTSSATGPAQFIDDTWLRLMRTHADRYGLPSNATPEQILALRTNPRWASLMAAEYANENQHSMSGALRRPITEREAYLGHFLGANEAARLLQAAQRGVADARAVVDARAVEANRNVFYRPDGRPRSAREVVDLQGRNFRQAPLKQRDGSR